MIRALLFFHTHALSGSSALECNTQWTPSSLWLLESKMCLLNPYADDSMNKCTYASGLNVFEGASRLPQGGPKTFSRVKALPDTQNAECDPSLVSSRDHLKPLMPMPMFPEGQGCARIMARSYTSSAHHGRKVGRAGPSQSAEGPSARLLASSCLHARLAPLTAAASDLPITRSSKLAS